MTVLIVIVLLQPPLGKLAQSRIFYILYFFPELKHVFTMF